MIPCNTLSLHHLNNLRGIGFFGHIETEAHPAPDEGILEDIESRVFPGGYWSETIGPQNSSDTPIVPMKAYCLSKSYKAFPQILILESTLLRSPGDGLTLLSQDVS